MTSAKRFLAASAVALCVTAGSNSTMAFVLDTFDTVNDVIVNAPAGNPVQSRFLANTPGAGSVLGGERDIYVARVFNNPFLTQANMVNAAVYAPATPGDPSQLYYTEVNGRRGEMEVTWDGMDGLATVDVDGLGVAGVDLTTNPRDDMFRLGVDTYSIGSRVALTLWEVGGGNDSWTVDLFTAGLGPENLDFMFSDFTTHGVDLAHIGAVKLGWYTAAPQTGATASFDWFGTAEVPEPGTIALMGALLGLGAFGAIRKRLTGVRQTAVA